MVRYSNLNPTLEAPGAGEAVNPARFDGLRGASKRKTKPVIGIDVIRTEVEPSAAGATTEIAARRAPTHEEIAKRAYEIYLERGGAPGSQDTDWSQAEQELRGS